jgi:hypothetical protein
MNEGWFKIHRGLFKKAIWLNSTPEHKVIMITLIGMANHEGKEWEWKGKQFKALPGEFVTSANSIIERAGSGISRQNVRSALTKFKKYDFLTYEATKTGLLISIVNWGTYQGEKTVDNSVSNQGVTNKSPCLNQEVTTNKNDKNDKNDKKYKYIYEFTQNKLLIKTIIDFIKMRNEIKKPMTDRALELMLNKLITLSKHEEMQIKILENSIQNCWQGIFKVEEHNKAFGFKDYSKRIPNGFYEYNKEMPKTMNNNGDKYGSIAANNGASEKKFNVKIPKWEPTEARVYAGEEPF